MSSELAWYASIFGVLFFTGLGLPPVPEEAGILYAASLNAVHPEVRWPFAWLATGLGIVCADLVLFGVGWRWGAKLFEYRWVQRFLKKERRLQLESRFHEHGMKLLILARFLPPLRTGVFLIAGAARYSVPKFLIADGVYAVFGVGLFFFFGTWVVGAIDHLRTWAGHWAIYLAAAPVVVYGLYRYYRYLSTREKRGDPEAPVSVAQGPAAAPPDGRPETRPEGAPEAMAAARELLRE
ncbi:DedA family protein [Gemmata sp.]|uniref:DedA family protein n=1 Tax=Gemmata sp. TaxID=1914242 RepID=UPI003F72ADB0